MSVTAALKAAATTAVEFQPNRGMLHAMIWLMFIFKVDVKINIDVNNFDLDVDVNDFDADVGINVVVDF